MSIAVTKLLPDGAVELSYADVDGVPHRGTRSPGDDISDLPADVQAAIAAHWTPERLAVWRAAQAAMTVPVDLAGYAAAKRYAKEMRGCIWNGWPVATDRDSQNKIAAEMLAIMAGARSDGDSWKFADGAFRMVSNADFILLADAVRGHVRNAFAAEATVLAQIAADTIATQQQIDMAFV